MDNNNNANRLAQNQPSAAEKAKMTKRDAGKKGGLAPHKCRGRGCKKTKPQNPSGLNDMMYRF